MGAALPIRDDLPPEALRRRARHEPNRRAALRMLAIANALEGVSRAEAARLAGMERQPCATPCSATTPRGSRGRTTGPSPAGPSG
jgi:hypothetical protein